MKFMPAQIAYLFSRPDTRRNLKAFFRLCIVLLAMIAVFSVLFHLIMLHVEGRNHSWITGVYWTLTVMTTLGFGDITFTSDLGRAFSVVVLGTGVVSLLILLPFTFIRFFYAPWLEAQIRLRAPREVPATTRDHVIICRWDSLAPGLVERLKSAEVPYFVLEPDATSAANLISDGISVVTGAVDNRETYARLRVSQARLVIANFDDATNLNITLTIREESAQVPIAAMVEDIESVDILKLSGATHVISLKETLGEHLAGRVRAGARRAHQLGRYGELVIAEFPFNGTAFVGRTVRDSGLRQASGVSLVGVWERGRLLRAAADTPLTDATVAVVCGTATQIHALEELIQSPSAEGGPVLVIGSGRVGQAVLRALCARGIQATVVDKSAAADPIVAKLAKRVVTGTATDIGVLRSAGIDEAQSIVITTSDDAVNIFLAAYCRKLKPELHIVSRITHERNLEAIHRAGANLVLSYASLGAKQLMAIVQERELVVLGDGVDVFMLDVKPSLHGRTLAESAIGARTGLTVIGVKHNGSFDPVAGPSTRLELGTALVTVGTEEQRRRYAELS